MRGRAVVVAAVLGLSGVAFAQEGQAPRQPMGQPTVQLSDTERDLMNYVYFVNNTEVRLGQLAQDKSQVQGVKQYGQRILQDHGKSNQQFSQLAQQAGVELSDQPKPMNEAEQRILDLQNQTNSVLEQAPPEQFDGVFLAGQVVIHDHAIAKVNEMMDKVTNPQLKRTLTQLIPILQQHRQQAYRLLGQPQVMARARRPAGR